MPKTRLYLLLLILGTAFWGVSFSFVKIGVEDGSPFVFLAYKFALATLVLAFLFHRRLRRMDRSALIAGLLIGVPLLLGNVFQTIALQHTSVTNTAFITGLDVLLIPVLKWSLFRQSVHRRVWIACGLALTGLYLIVAKDGLSLNQGDLWTVACAVFFASYVVGAGRFAPLHDPIQTVIVALGFCAAGCAVAAGFDDRAIWFTPEPAFWRGILFAAIFATAYMYAVQNVAQRYIPEEKIGLTYLCEPLFATLAGMVLLGEALTIRTALGAGFILIAMAVIDLTPETLRRTLRFARRQRTGQEPMV
ncbi:DMT family transporter [Pararhodobacter sp. CCB-MM2]|uniref:DMT family transporter n=1 Tax=Pararhodobacter sp. CCB-MM2 TaxID=1786003 RepID=UPI00082DDB2C|nr:DMT family transporter [Pararhodobacter sp. CCB-MM2]